MSPEAELGPTSSTRRPPAPGSYPPPEGRRAEHGFTIVEVMVAVLVLIVGGLALVSLVDAANGATTSNQQREAGTNLAREMIETAGLIAYDDVTPDRLIPALQARPPLSDSNATGGGYTLERRGVTYTVALEVCNLDDPSDGIGSHATGTDGVPFCSDSGLGGTSDDRPGDYRRVKADVSWTRDGETKDVRQSSFVLPPSGSDLPVVTTLTPSPSSPITTSAANVTFTGTTSSVPAGVSWFQDGTEKDEASGSGTGPWSFTWPIGPPVGGLVDGDYVIGARARTGGGSFGPVHSLTMKLNRLPPAQPQGFVAGKNGASVDAEWRANRERDIEGYTVYRKQTAPTTGVPQQVNCGTVGTPVYRTTSLTCTDASPLTVAPSISFVSQNSATTEQAAVAVNRPAGVVAGDVMIATVATSTGTAISNVPSGWTEIQNISPTAGAQGIRHASYWKVMPSGNEPAAYSWTVGTGRSSSASITAWRGVNTASPIDASAQGNGGNVSGAVETAPPVTTTQSNDVVIRAFAHRGPSNSPPQMTLTTPASNTLRSTNRSFSTVHGQYSRVQAAAGASGTATSTCATNCTQWAAHTIALKPSVTLAADYWVTALDLDGANYREGPASNPVPAYAANNAPTAPSGLSGAPATNGSNVVSWITPGTDPDGSNCPPVGADCVAFYRVYRDGGSVPYDRTALGTDLTWTDPRPGSGTHTYLLKAVDTHLAGSPASTSVSVTQP